LAQVRPIVRALDASLAPEPASHAPSRAPLFAAVTTFAHSAEADAHAAVLARPAHQALRAALAHSAAAVYQDPAAAVTRVEQALHGGQDPFELGALLRADPAAVGELR